LYWYSIGGGATGELLAQEAPTVLGADIVQQIQDMGGIVAAPNESSHVGDIQGLWWFSGDVAFADQLVACAIQQRHIDTQHIHSVGSYLGGGGMTTYLWYVRSGYLASVVTYWGGLYPHPADLQDPSHVPPALVEHGDPMKSGEIGGPSGTWEMDLQQRNAFFIDCNDGSATPSSGAYSIAPQAWQFLKDHPFGVSPEPYTKLSAPWPTYCTIM
jgi:hypothetical protein